MPYPRPTAQKLAELNDAVGHRRYVGPRGITEVLAGRRMRAVGSTIYIRPLRETFDEFIVAYLILVFGEQWGKEQFALPEVNRHIVIQWFVRAQQFKNAQLTSDRKPGDLISIEPSGDMMELTALAEDIYRLSLVNCLPQELLEKLRSRHEFQGARYEVAVSACLVRAGFSINWIERQRKKTAEFEAVLDGEAIHVEVKSRRRKGFIHESGHTEDPDRLQADVERLYNQALTKHTEGKPLLVCIDVNLPLRPSLAYSLPEWSPYVRRFLDRHEASAQNPAKEFCLILTNFNWHFSGPTVPHPKQYIYTFPDWSCAIPQRDSVYVGILQAFQNYGTRPEGPY